HIDRTRLLRRSQQFQHAPIMARRITSAVFAEQARTLAGGNCSTGDTGAFHEPALAAHCRERTWKRRRHGPYEVMDLQSGPPPVDPAVFRATPAEVLAGLDPLWDAALGAGQQCG